MYVLGIFFLPVLSISQIKATLDCRMQHEILTLRV
jgi:hypothetical protein